VFILITPICILCCICHNVVLNVLNTVSRSQKPKLNVCLVPVLYTLTLVPSFISDLSINKMSPAFCQVAARDREWFIAYASRYNYVRWVLSSCPRMFAFPYWVFTVCCSWVCNFLPILQPPFSDGLEGIPSTAVGAILMTLGIPRLAFAVHWVHLSCIWIWL
jgi:hypothetical protein